MNLFLRTTKRFSIRLFASLLFLLPTTVALAQNNYTNPQRGLLERFFPQKSSIGVPVGRLVVGCFEEGAVKVDLNDGRVRVYCYRPGGKRVYQDFTDEEDYKRKLQEKADEASRTEKAKQEEIKQREKRLIKSEQERQEAIEGAAKARSNQRAKAAADRDLERAERRQGFFPTRFSRDCTWVNLGLQVNGCLEGPHIHSIRCRNFETLARVQRCPPPLPPELLEQPGVA